LQSASEREIPDALGAAAADGRPVRPRGGATKITWGTPGEAESLPPSPAGIREHNAGDLTLVAGAGTPLAGIAEQARAHNQMLSLDPPLLGAATLGGVVAANDSGPLRHRYGSARDLVVGVRVALPDGTVARAGGKVIKNVAGYDLGKLFTGSLGTLGAILELSVRLHPLPPRSRTVVGRSDDPEALAGAALELSHAPLELEGLDVRWEDGAGTLLARCSGSAPGPPAAAASRIMDGRALETELVEEDDGLWEAQRAAQRSPGHTVVKVSARQTQLGTLLAAARSLGARVVGRAGLGLAWVTLAGAPVEGLAALRRALSPASCVVLDSPPGSRLDVWGPRDPGALELMRRVKRRFDPAGICAPGALGI
jgi:glycolate oxidase FAD binding subunit